MRTLIISSSTNPDSRSYQLCRKVEEELQKNSENEVVFIDLREKAFGFHYQPETEDMKKIAEEIQNADNFVLGMAVRNYCINDELKSISESCFRGNCE